LNLENPLSALELNVSVKATLLLPHRKYVKTPGDASACVADSDSTDSSSLALRAASLRAASSSLALSEASFIISVLVTTTLYIYTAHRFSYALLKMVLEMLGHSSASAQQVTFSYCRMMQPHCLDGVHQHTTPSCRESYGSRAVALSRSVFHQPRRDHVAIVQRVDL
jgi:hypothetical protein